MVFLTTSWRQAVIVTVAAVAISVSTIGSAIAQTLNGAGASFPNPLYQRYVQQFQQETGIVVNYDSVGSGAGIDRFLEDTVDFAGSDVPPTQSEIDRMSKGLVMVPTAGGAVAVVYNLSGVSNLKLSGSVLSDIFLGKITKWSDRRIAKDNPGVDLPDIEIKPVVRADGSGTTFIFTRHLSAASPIFKSRVNISRQPNWPGEPLTGERNDGVAEVVKQTEGAIGYVQDTFARKNNLSTAAIENLAGRFVEPTYEEANKALAEVRFYRDFTTANEGNPDDGYPIVGITWLLVKQRYDSEEKAEAMKKFVAWILSKGQEINPNLEYTRIPEAIAIQVMNAVENEVAVK